MIIEGKKDKDRIIVSVAGRMDAVSAPDFDRRCEDWLVEGQMSGLATGFAGVALYFPTVGQFPQKLFRPGIAVR